MIRIIYNSDQIVTHKGILKVFKNDLHYQQFCTSIVNRLASSKKDLDLSIYYFPEIKEGLATSDFIILIKDCLLIPDSHRKHALSVFHPGNIIVTSMQISAKATTH